MIHAQVKACLDHIQPPARFIADSTEQALVGNEPAFGLSHAREFEHRRIALAPEAGGFVIDRDQLGARSGTHRTQGEVALTCTERAQFAETAHAHRQLAAAVVQGRLGVEFEDGRGTPFIRRTIARGRPAEQRTTTQQGCRQRKLKISSDHGINSGL